MKEKEYFIDSQKEDKDALKKLDAENGNGIFEIMKNAADTEMLGYVAASIDLEVAGTRDEMYQEILRALKAKEKYESNRLRR